jgi:hypothetical protein
MSDARSSLLRLLGRQPKYSIAPIRNMSASPAERRHIAADRAPA